MKTLLSRRDFLKLGGLAIGGLSLTSLGLSKDFHSPFPYSEEQDQGNLARVAIKQIDLHTKPNDEAPIVGNRFRDQLVQIYDEVIPADAPEFFNKLWYKVWGGFLHSAHLQRVKIALNEPDTQVSDAGRLAEVTVPYTEAYQYNEREGWYPWRGSRLYYSTTHWVTGVLEGPDGEPWYQITSELSKAEKYFAPAKHLRLISAEEIAPLSPGVSPDKKRIEVSLAEQTLRAFENGNLVLETKISSGIPNGRLSKDELPTATPKGKFRIYAKQPSKHMGSITGNPDAEANGGFSLPGVPWTLFFKSPGGYAFHGTYWHNNFGLQMSHGCVNMRNEDAKWLFRWTTPAYDQKIESPADWERRGNGTAVNVF
jgi:lipoprotein-anchoring transpeptidase ErfK/SrfK